MTINAGVADRLPVKILLGRDVPQLIDLLKNRSARVASSEIVAVTTRSRPHCVDSCSSQPPSVDKDCDSVKSNSSLENHSGLDEQNTSGGPEDFVFGTEFANELFEASRDRQRLTRSRKRAARREYALKHPKSTTPTGQIPIGKEELIKCQNEDKSLEGLHAVAKGKKDTAVGEGFFYRDGVLYRRKARGQMDDAREQLVLPSTCRPP